MKPGDIVHIVSFGYGTPNVHHPCYARCSAVNNHADDGLVDEARALYGSDEIEIDDYAVGVSRANDGTWVNAWVWVPNDDDETDDLQDCQEGLTGGNA